MGFLIGLMMRFVGWISDGLSSVGRFFDHLFVRGLDAAGQITSVDRWIGPALLWVFWPVRWFFGLIASSGGSESWFARTIAWILWPFFYVVDRLDRIGRPAERQFTERDFERDEEQLEKRLSRSVEKTTVKENLSRTWVSRLGDFAAAPFVGSGEFVWQLLSTRRAGLWLWSLPLLLIGGLLASVYFIAQFGQDPRIVARYEAALSQAIKAGDSDKTQLYRMKLAQLGSSTVRGEYQTALALSESGKTSEAYELMKKLAPDNQVGFEGAHFWIAQKLIEGSLEVSAPESLRLALKHLELLRTRTGDEPELRLLEGLAFARLGEIPAAINTLTPIADSNVVASFLLMEVYASRGKSAEAKAQAVNVHRKLTQAIQQGQELTEDQRKWQTAATKVIGDTKLATEAVEQWYQANPTSVEARVNRTQLLLQQVNEWCRSPNPANLEDIKQKLIQAAATVPYEQAGMVSAVATIICQQKKQNDMAEALYQQLLEEEQLSGIIIESFGTMAAVEKDYNLADALLRRATTASPDWGNGWNNWAFVISAAFPERLEEALRHVERAITINPDNPDYRETRGMIFYKLRNYEQAIVDLEIAINGINELDSVHAALADSHRRLGNNSVAEIYERQITRRRN